MSIENHVLIIRLRVIQAIPFMYGIMCYKNIIFEVFNVLLSFLKKNKTFKTVKLFI